MVQHNLKSSLHSWRNMHKSVLTTISMQTCLLKHTIHYKYDAYKNNRYEKRINMVGMSFRTGQVYITMGPSWRGLSWQRSELSMICSDYIKD